MFFSVRRDDGAPIRRQLREQIRGLVYQGTLPLGTKLPSSRALARTLGVSRNTVIEVYESLVADGILEPSSTAGTFVAWRQERRPTARAETSFLRHRAEPTVPWGHLFSEGLKRLSERPGARGISPARLQAWWDETSAEQFRTCLNRALRQQGPAILGYGAPEGYPPLREWLAAHMTDRGVRVGADGVLIVNGSQQGMDLVARAFVDPDDLVLVQEPVQPDVVSCFRQIGARVKGIPMGAGGLDLEVLEGIVDRENPKLVYVMPAVHDPTGATMDLPTRTRLLECARQSGFVVLEDAVNDELCYSGHLVPPLKAQDPSGQVIYVGSMSKSLFPGIRIGWIVAEPPALAALTAAKKASDLCSAPLLQAALSEFCRLGYSRRHLARARRVYRAAHEALDRALAQHFPPGTDWKLSDGCPAVWVSLPAAVDARRLQQEAAAKGVRIEPGELFFVEGGGEHSFRVAWPEASPLQIERDVTVLGKLIRTGLARGRAGRVKERGA